MENGYYLVHEESGEWYDGKGGWTNIADCAFCFTSEEQAITAEPFCHDKHVRVYKLELVA